MKYWKCLTCHRTIDGYKNEQLLRCRCGEYDSNLLIEVDSKGFPVKKIKEEHCKEVSDNENKSK
jgi:hypothetical protein